MDKWQKDYITEHLTSLVNDLNCNVTLLSSLCSYGVLANDDVCTLTAVGNSNGELSKSYQLLQILITRVRGYEHLAKSLYSSKQTGALLTLLYGVQINLPHQNPFEFCGIELNANELITKSVNFQGEILPLCQACKSMNTVRLQQIIKENMDATSYRQLLSEKSITLAVQSVPKSIPFYIPRSLSLKTEVEPAVFEALPKDIFLIEGVELHQLTKLFSRQSRTGNTNNVPRVDKSSNQLYQLVVKIILLEHHDHFTMIADQSTHHVHWLRYRDGKYDYVKSNGGKATSRIKKYITGDCTVISQENFIGKSLNESDNSCPVILYDSPGMGKSILLAELARELKRQQPEGSVIFLQFAELIKHLTAAGGHFHAGAFQRSLLDIITTSKLSRNIMKDLFKNPYHKIEVFLDGFDELHENDTAIAATMLKCIGWECKNIRLWITTRRHRGDQLENLFGVLGHNILPFSEQNQISFFTKYWETQHDVIPTEEVREFAKYCLITFNKHISSEDRAMAGIPLQCRMLAELYARSAKVEDKTAMESEYRINSIYKMYKEYIHLKFASAAAENEQRTALYEYHVNLALHLLFPNDFHDETCTLDLSKIYAIGVLESSHSDRTTPNFVHRTFAEFIAAEYFVSYLAGNYEPKVSVLSFLNIFLGTALKSQAKEPHPNDLVRIYLKKVAIRWFNNSVVAKFLNHFLADGNMNQPNEIFRKALRESSFFEPVTFANLLAACLTSNLKHLFIFIFCLYLEIDSDNSSCQLSLRHCLPEDNETQNAGNLYVTFISKLRKLDQLKLLVKAASRYSTFELFKLSYEFLCELSWEGLKDLDLMLFLRVAARRGNYQIFNYLLKLSQPDFGKALSLLEECTAYSYKDHPDVAAEKVQIMKHILSEHAELLDACNVNGISYPPLLSNYGVHFDLIKCLIESGADVTKTYVYGENVCHFTAHYMSDVDYHQFIELMIMKHQEKLLIAYNYHKQTPIDIALGKIELKTETLELLSKEGKVDFSRCSFRGSLLHSAVSGGRSRRVLEDIVKLGGNWRFEFLGRNVMHYAADAGNTDAINYFHSLGADPNKICLCVDPPLNIALRKSESRFETVKALLENDADANGLVIKNSGNNDNACTAFFTFKVVTPLQYAREAEADDIVHLLERHGAETSACKSRCVTSCLYCLCLPCVPFLLCCHCLDCVRCGCDCCG